jgi:hypothetical protein
MAVKFVTAVAAKAAPTVTELTGGTDLTGFLTRDGLKTPATGNTVDISDASSLFNSTAPGSYGGDAAELTCYRDTLAANDTAWTALARGTTGFLVVARNGFGQDTDTGQGTNSGTPATGDRCEVYPVTVISRAMADTADNEASKFVVSLAITQEPADSAVVATA